MLRLTTILILTLTFAASSFGIVRRDDRDDSRYLELADGYPMVCRVGGGMGTLIDSIWVLTAGHVAYDATPEQTVIRFGQREVVVAQVVVHPDFAVEGKHRDIGLIKLAQPVLDVPVAHLYRNQDELGSQNTFVGDGYTGTGIDGPTKGERVMRAAHNTVDSVSSGWLRYTFDAPPDGDDLEGISGPGDSGGPALLVKGDSLFVIGVSAYNDGNPECTYGSHEFYCRVSDEVDWLDGVMSGQITPEPRSRMMRFGENESGVSTAASEEVIEVSVPDSENARLVTVLKQLVASIDSNSQTDYLALFVPKLVDKKRAASDPLEGLHTFLVSACAKRGPIAGFHPLSDQGIQIPESDFPMRPIVFHLKDGISGYFGIALNDGGLIDHFSVFIQTGICPKGKACDETVPLEELAH